MDKTPQPDIQYVIAAQFKEGVSMLDLAIQHDMSYTDIQNAIRAVMIKEGRYDDSRYS